MSDQDELLALLRRNNELLTVLVKAEIGTLLESELAEDRKKKLYDLVGKSVKVADMSKQIGISTGAISGILQDWETKGILIKEGKKYRRVLDDK